MSELSVNANGLPIQPKRVRLIMDRETFKAWSENRPIMLNSSLESVREAKRAEIENVFTKRQDTPEFQYFGKDPNFGWVLMHDRRSYIKHEYFMKYGPCTVRTPNRARQLFKIQDSPLDILHIDFETRKVYRKDQKTHVSKKPSAAPVTPAGKVGVVPPSAMTPEECPNGCLSYVWHDIENKVVTPPDRPPNTHNPTCFHHGAWELKKAQAGESSARVPTAGPVVNEAIAEIETSEPEHEPSPDDELESESAPDDTPTVLASVAQFVERPEPPFEAPELWRTNTVKVELKSKPQVAASVQKFMKN